MTTHSRIARAHLPAGAAGMSAEGSVHKSADRSQAAAANRAAFPQLAALVDEIRERYPEARLVAGIEDWREIGKVDDELRVAYGQASVPAVTETEEDRLRGLYAAERAAAGVRQ